MKTRFLISGAAAVLFSLAATAGSFMLSGNENKIGLTSGNPSVIPNALPDSLSLLDFSTMPPEVTEIPNVSNSVVGPPSNIAISPDGRLALVASSIKVPSASSTNFVPDKIVHILDLSARPPRVIGKIETDLQPSGISFTADGKQALVANRASGTISVLSVDGQNVRLTQTVKVCEPAESLSDVAISPDGKLVLASAQKGGFIALLKRENGMLSAISRKISASGQPYRCVITPDGELGLCGGPGFGNGMDVDALTIIDLKAQFPHTIGYVPLGSVPESIELSPDGQLLAAVVMDGSNLPPNHPELTKEGSLVILQRKGKTYVQTQRLRIGPIPEGVAFTGDGRFLAVQCHPERAIWIFKVSGKKVTDTGVRVAVPGMPSSLRASQK
jgi:WD40 repeat protein